MTDTLTPAEQAADRAHRAAALAHFRQYAPALPDMLGNMPAPAGPPGEVHAALDLLGAALGEVGAAVARTDAPDSPAFMYGAACASYSRVLSLFLFEHEPEDPHRAAVLFITFTTSRRDQLTAGNAEAAAFLEGADAGTLTPETAGVALNNFPSASALTAFLGAHHAFSLAVDALMSPADADPRGKLRDALGVMRQGVQTVTPSRADA